MTREFDSFDAIQTANFGFVVTLADAETAEKFAYKMGIEDTIKAVLEIIDEAQTYKMAVGSTDLFIDREAFREEVLALKGGEQG